jgi:uncharacterized Fe-S center protein
MPGKKPSIVYFADAAYDRLEPNRTLPAKFERMLKRLDLGKRVKDKRVGIKMHFGGGSGYSTIPTVIVRMVVKALQDAGAKSIKAMDNDPADGLARGYTREVLGCEIVSTFGASRKYLVKEKIGFKSLDFVEFGGALKNIAMGLVPGPSRSKLHNLEGGISYDEEKCTFCLKCRKACPNHAIGPQKNKKKISIFFHNCTYCQHCVLICPEKSLKMENRKFQDFSHGMALVTSKFLKRFPPENLLFINVLLNITIFCDCWGMTTPALVPDIGITASNDIVAVEHASLDLIKTENFLANGLPKDRELLAGDGHLFEKIHGKDPYFMLQSLQKLYGGNSEYKLEEIK